MNRKIVGLFLAMFAYGCTSPPAKDCSTETDCLGAIEDMGHTGEGDEDWGLMACPPDQRLAHVNGTEGCFPSCQADPDCAANASCHSGICVPDGKYAALLLQFSTESPGDCSETEPGPDIMWVRLEDGAGGLLGWGRVVDSSILGAANAFADASHLDGEAPPYDTASCPAFDDATVVSMGCEEAWLLLEFVDDNGGTRNFGTGDVVVIAEYGDQCPDDAGQHEELEAILCTQRDIGSCSNFLIGGGGLITREVN